MKQCDFRTISYFGAPSTREASLAFTQLAQRGSLPLLSPHSEVLKGNVPLASGEQGVAIQAGGSALLNVTKLNRDDLIFRPAGWTGEGDWL
jgi:hypothetical protein